MARRFGDALIIFAIVFVCGWASSVNSSSNKRAAAELHVGIEAETLATALFLLGNAFAALSGAQYIKRLRVIEKEHVSDNEEASVEPQIRLMHAFFCAPLFPVSLFWLGRTNYSSISPWPDLAAAMLFSFSLQGIFLSTY